MRILIGYDGSVDADGALHDLQRAGLPAKAEVRVLVAVIPFVPFGPDGQIPAAFGARYGEHLKMALAEGRDLAARAAGSLSRSFPGWKVKTRVVEHEPAHALLEEASTWKADLMVLGSHGRTALARLLIGSVSQAVLHHAPCDVRLTRPKLRRSKSGTRVLVAVDGSAGSEAAVSAVARRPWSAGTVARIIGVVDAYPAFGSYFPGSLPEFQAESARIRKEWIGRKVEKAAARLAKAGLKVERAVPEDDPREGILAEAKAWNADVLFLGSRGMGFLGRLLLGSVSSSVAAHAPCTVEVVRVKRTPGRAARGARGGK